MRGLLFPLWLLVRLLSRKKKKRSELEEKQRKYVRNFAPGRLKNVSWQKSVGKDRKKRYKKRKKVKKDGKFSGKGASNLKGY
jgi:hypothetical protein